MCCRIVSSDSPIVGEDTIYSPILTKYNDIKWKIYECSKSILDDKLGGERKAAVNTV